MPAAIVLCDIEPRYADAVDAATRGRDIRVVRLAGDPTAPLPELPLAGVVVGLGAEPEALERVHVVRKQLRASPLVVLAAPDAVENAFHAAHLGARALVRVPAPPARVARRVMDVCTPPPGPAEPSEAEGPTGASRAARALRARLEAIAPTGSTVLLTGETGTGKGLVARALHHLSPRRGRPFVHVDCAGLAPTVIESELFGHERGAFTGAVERREGRLELAGEGTLFLDEIGELDPALQAKFLRVLEEREYDRVGSARPLRLHARVIAATNRDLLAEVRAGRFRADLYYRLRVVQVRVPPLRERLEDLPTLVDRGLDEICARLGVPRPAVDAGFCRVLSEYDWPGNVRELMNVVESAMVSGPALLGAVDGLQVLQDLADPPAAEASGYARLEEAGSEEEERALLARLLRATGGNRARVARRLGIPRSTLRYRIRKHELGHLVPRD